jgi:hypothetical protein
MSRLGSARARRWGSAEAQRVCRSPWAIVAGQAGAAGLQRGGRGCRTLSHDSSYCVRQTQSQRGAAREGGGAYQYGCVRRGGTREKTEGSCVSEAQTRRAREGSTSSSCSTRETESRRFLQDAQVRQNCGCISIWMWDQTAGSTPCGRASTHTNRQERQDGNGGQRACERTFRPGPITCIASGPY